MLKILGIRNQTGHNRNNFFLLQDLWDLFWDTSESGCDLITGTEIFLRYLHSYVSFSSVQSLSHFWLFATPGTAAHQASLSITNSQSSLKLMSIESMMPYSHLILCCPLLLLPSIFPSIRVFSNESALRVRWPKYWSFSFNISPTNKHPGLISFRMDWFNLLAVLGILKSLLQYHSSKASILCAQPSLWSTSHIHTWLLEKL